MTADALLHWVRSASPRTRIVAVTGALCLLGVAVLVALLSHQTRAPLFARPLGADQLNEVQEQLAQWNVAFTPLSDNVVVDPTQRNQILLRLSLAGVPHEHLATTSETLASVGALTPQSVIDVQARNGLADDIALALRSVAGVDDARVIIAPAKSAEFADESPRDASASVRLVLHPGATLAQGAAAGIRAFVAASVPDLDSAHVTILDDRGVALGDQTAGDDGDRLQRDVQSALDAALGAGVAIVRVTPIYSRSTIESHDVRRAPLGEASIERSVSAESYLDGTKHYQKNDESDDRGSETRETVTHLPPGSIVRVSTAVIVDASRDLDLAAVRAIVAAAVGYDLRRGDSLDVQAVDFHHTLQAKHDGWLLAYGAIVPVLPTLVVVAGLLIFARSAGPSVARIAAALVEKAATTRTQRAVAGFAPSQVRGALAHEPPHAAAAIISALPAATAAAVLELYPQHEREAIVARMQRTHASIVPDAEEVLRSHG